MARTITQRVVRTAREKYGVTVYTRAAWGSTAQSIYANRRRTRPVRVRKADTIVFHVTVTRDDGDSKQDFFADMREVERIGVERFGSGVSYNFCIDMKTGEVGVGQPLDAKGTHTVNNKGVKGYSHDQNHAARAIAAIGMPGDKLSDKSIRAYAGLIAAMMDEGAVTTSPDAVPHSLFAAKDCPTDPVRTQIQTIMKTAKQLRAAAGQPDPQPEPAPTGSKQPDRDKPLRRALLAAENEARKVGRLPLAERLRKRRLALRPQKE